MRVVILRGVYRVNLQFKLSPRTVLIAVSPQVNVVIRRVIVRSYIQATILWSRISDSLLFLNWFGTQLFRKMGRDLLLWFKWTCHWICLFCPLSPSKGEHRTRTPRESSLGLSGITLATCNLERFLLILYFHNELSAASFHSSMSSFRPPEGLVNFTKTIHEGLEAFLEVRSSLRWLFARRTCTKRLLHRAIKYKQRHRYRWVFLLFESLDCRRHAHHQPKEERHILLIISMNEPTRDAMGTLDCQDAEAFEHKTVWVVARRASFIMTNNLGHAGAGLIFAYFRCSGFYMLLRWLTEATLVSLASSEWIETWLAPCHLL